MINDEIRAGRKLLREQMLHYNKVLAGANPTGETEEWLEKMWTTMLRLGSAVEAWSANWACERDKESEQLISALREYRNQFFYWRGTGKVQVPYGSDNLVNAQDFQCPQIAIDQVGPRKPRFKPPPCPRCGGKSKVIVTRDDYRDIACTQCSHAWQPPID